jgi:hypothetical protein
VNNVCARRRRRRRRLCRGGGGGFAAAVQTASAALCACGVPQALVQDIVLAVDAAAGADVSAQAVGVKLAYALRSVAGLDEGQVRNGLVALADAKFAVPNKLPRCPEVDDGRDAERAHRAARSKLARTFVCA